uniref:Uncharacterized protein n=1 Tax=Aegilops tauschii subsp. strangulata TaxID=200361 RepID=A0A453FZ69_AEGTS
PHALSLLFPTPDLLAPRVFSWFGSPPHCLRRNPSVFSHSYEVRIMDPPTLFLVVLIFDMFDVRCFYDRILRNLQSRSRI